MGELGFYAPNLDGYGLPGVGEKAYGLLMQELEACDSGLRSMASVQGALVMYPIHAFGSEEQKERWLPALGAGEAVGCFGLTEPEHGSNPSAMETRAERAGGHAGDEYVLNGSKTWITNSPSRTSRWSGRRTPPRTAPSGASSWRPTATASRRTRSTTSSASGPPSRARSASRTFASPGEPSAGRRGDEGPLSCLTQARYGIAWGAVGAARDCFETARQYATDREQFGKPIGGFQMQQQKLAEMATQITTSQLLAHRLADLKERGDLRPQHVSMAKRNNVRMARDQARVAREMLGGNGITTDYPPMRHMANMETVYTYEGTHDIHTLILGEDLTGIPAYE